MSHDKIGPREQQLRDMREARAARAEADAKVARPSPAELREKIATIKPKVDRSGAIRIGMAKAKKAKKAAKKGAKP